MPLGSNVVLLGSADGTLKWERSSSLWLFRFVSCKGRRGPSKELGLYSLLKKGTDEQRFRYAIHTRIEFNQVPRGNLLNRTE